MTGDNGATVRTRPLLIAGRPVAAHLHARVPALTRRVVDRLLSELPVYARLPREEVVGDIAGIVRHNLRVFARVLERRTPATAAELAEQRDSAAQRAEEGVPLDAVLSAYHLGMESGWQEITRGARPGDLTDVQDALSLMMAFHRTLTSTVSAAYLEVRQVLDSQEHADRHALLASLLAGRADEEAPRSAGLRPAERYAVLTLALAPHPDESGPGGSVAARRKVRRVQSELDAYVRESALVSLDASGGTALLPVAAPPPWEELRALVARASRSAGTAITAAGATAERRAVPAAVARNAEVVEVVRRTGRPPGLYRLADVLLEYQLSRPGPAREGLAGLLAPLADRPDLLRTLESYLASGLDRRTTAESLHIHPNTVDYRVRRIESLTGLHPARAVDLPYLNAALLARSSDADA
ncbi:PucR family transcriptional regulator [Streptomyces xiaopingdaonensis]|uniref:PucR family transcriptional regulator n=1 Tax=Streptomyces xiaopingdaonensis TaxID=1565415 RepID=UPI00030D4D5F|nr:helix-turn-helix domain-containing protein [Streptomyces xiaopingdaonensis]